MPQITFFTDARMTELWGYVKMLLTFASPSVLMAVAIIAVGMVLTIVISAWKNAASKKEEQDDDYEIKHY